MKRSKISPVSNDDRGAITEVCTGRTFQHVAYVTFVPGANRGDHYHPESRQVSFVIAGTLYAYTKTADGTVEGEVLTPGDVIEHDPGEAHSFVALTDATLLCLSEGPRGGSGYEVDTVRLGAGALAAAYAQQHQQEHRP